MLVPERTEIDIGIGKCCGSGSVGLVVGAIGTGFGCFHAAFLFFFFFDTVKGLERSLGSLKASALCIFFSAGSLSADWGATDIDGRNAPVVRIFFSLVGAGGGALGGLGGGRGGNRREVLA